jgi:hypothetical protein
MSPINNLEVTALLCNVAPNTLRSWIRQGAPVLQHADKRRGIEWKINFPDLLQWRIDRAIHDAITRTQDENGNISRDEADRRKAVAQATLAEVEADEKLRGVLLRTEAERMTQDFLDSIKEGLAPVAAIVAEPISKMSDPNRIRALYDDEINKAYLRAKTIFAAKRDATGRR